MNSRYLWRIASVAILSLALSRNTSADTLKSNADNIIIGVVAVVAVVVVVVAVVIHRSAKQKTVTGCVTAAQNGMSVTDENNKRIYRLSGDTAAIKPGDRMTLRGKTIKPSGSNSLTWVTTGVAKDFGVCQP
jgi:hypothetical protein